MKKQKNTWSTLKGILWCFGGLLVLGAIGAFAVQAMPIQTTPNTPTTNTPVTPEPETPAESRIKLVTSNIDDTFLENVDVVCLDSSGKEVNKMNFGETYTIKFVPLNGATIVSARDNNWNDITGVNSFTFTPSTYNDQWLMCDVQTNKDKALNFRVDGYGFTYTLTNSAGQAVTDLIVGETYYFNPTLDDGVSMTSFQFAGNAVENPTFPYEFVATRDCYIWLQTDFPIRYFNFSVNGHGCTNAECTTCNAVNVTLTDSNGAIVGTTQYLPENLIDGETYTVNVTCNEGFSIYEINWNPTGSGYGDSVTLPFTFTAENYRCYFDVRLDTFKLETYIPLGCQLLFYDTNGVLAETVLDEFGNAVALLKTGETYTVNIVVEDGYVNTDWETKTIIAERGMWLSPSVEPISIVPELPENITATITPLEDWETFSALKFGSGYKFEFTSNDGREIKQVLLNGYDLPLGKFVWFDFTEANFEFVYAE